MKKAIIIGAGKVGLQISESLINEKHEVTVIDYNQHVINKVDESIDVFALRGNGVSSNLLGKINCGGADLLIAVTGNDEANIIACITAKQLGTKTVIARVKNPEYMSELDFLRKKLGIDYILNPELATAHEILRLLLNTHSLYAEDFAKGMIRISEEQITPSSGFLNKQIKNLDLQKSIIITAILRKGKIIIPEGTDYLYSGDTLFVVGDRPSVDLFDKRLSTKTTNAKIKNALIIGGGKTSYYLAKKLEQIGVNIKIIEQNSARCRELAEDLRNTLVLQGDGTDISLLKAERIEEMDSFISLTGFDEENMLVALLAKQLGVKKVIAKVSRSNYISLIETIGIDNTVTPKLITARDILRIVRGGKILSMALLLGGQAEVFEIIIQDHMPLVNKSLKENKLPKGVIIGAIFREGRVIIPDGETVIKSNDRAIVFTLEKNIGRVNQLFAEKRGS